MSETSMDLYFCDLCNESIPQADLDLGRAVRRNDRLICVACESAMSSGSARPERPRAEVEVPQLVAPAPPPPPPPPSTHSSSSSVPAVALAFASVALVAVVGASAYLYW